MFINLINLSKTSEDANQNSNATLSQCNMYLLKCTRLSEMLPLALPLMMLPSMSNKLILYQHH